MSLAVELMQPAARSVGAGDGSAESAISECC
jgi:hypothetical protein